jgi:hypothetical protein
MRRRVELLPGEEAATEDEFDTSETIGQAKTLTVRQFYYIYCFLSGMWLLNRQHTGGSHDANLQNRFVLPPDIKACAAHTVRFDKSAR